MRDRRRAFVLDSNAVRRILKGHDINVPVFGGGLLDRILLQCKCLLLGLLQNNLDILAFRTVAQELEHLLHSFALPTTTKAHMTVS